jgi:signal recognition particle receptor subunit beta
MGEQQSLRELDKNLKESYELKTVPLVLQFNKRDLPTALPADEMYRQLNSRVSQPSRELRNAPAFSIHWPLPSWCSRS